MKRIVVLSDMQIPLHNKPAINAVIKFVKDYQPDELFCVGDEADCLAPARWSKDMLQSILIYNETLMKLLLLWVSFVKQ